ncbi:hypothetical protein CR513_13676, partial [Mucuna pruriens]
MEERLRAVEGGDKYDLEAVDLCLVLDVGLPADFKTLEFDKFKWSSYSRVHLAMYCQKMVAYIYDDKILVHCFYDRLIGVAILLIWTESWSEEPRLDLINGTTSSWLRWNRSGRDDFISVETLLLTLALTIARELSTLMESNSFRSWVLTSHPLWRDAESNYGPNIDSTSEEAV